MVFFGSTIWFVYYFKNLNSTILQREPYKTWNYYAIGQTAGWTVAWMIWIAKTAFKLETREFSLAFLFSAGLVPAINFLLNFIFAIWILSLYGTNVRGEDTITASQDEFFGFWYGMPMIAFTNLFIVLKLFPVFWKELFDNNSAAMVTPSTCKTDDGEEVECWRVAIENSKRKRKRERKTANNSFGGSGGEIEGVGAGDTSNMII